MGLKKIMFALLAGLALTVSAAAQEKSLEPGVVEDPAPDPSVYFNPNPSKLGEKFSIFFSRNIDDFTDLPNGLVEWNNKIVQTLKTFLESHPEYAVKVRGGTNGAMKDLDTKRIAVATKILHFIGVPGTRILASRPTESKDWLADIGGLNGWMNRRVDFELVLNER